MDLSCLLVICNLGLSLHRAAGYSSSSDRSARVVLVMVPAPVTTVVCGGPLYCCCIDNVLIARGTST